MYRMFSKMIQIVKFRRSPKRKVYSSLSFHFSQGKLCVSFRDHSFTSPLLISFEKDPSFIWPDVEKDFWSADFFTVPTSQKTTRCFWSQNGAVLGFGTGIILQTTQDQNFLNRILVCHSSRKAVFAVTSLAFWTRFCWTEKRKGETICCEWSDLLVGRIYT